MIRHDQAAQTIHQLLAARRFPPIAVHRPGTRTRRAPQHAPHHAPGVPKAQFRPHKAATRARRSLSAARRAAAAPAHDGGAAWAGACGGGPAAAPCASSAATRRCRPPPRARRGARARGVSRRARGARARAAARRAGRGEGREARENRCRRKGRGRLVLSLPLSPSSLSLPPFLPRPWPGPSRAGRTGSDRGGARGAGGGRACGARVRLGPTRAEAEAPAQACAGRLLPQPGG